MKIAKAKFLLLYILIAFVFRLNAQKIPSDQVLPVRKLSSILKVDIQTELSENGGIPTAKLAAYFREKFSERFFYDYQKFDDRLALYHDLYANQNGHKNRALDHLSKYADSTRWVLPFNYLTGEAVNAYALRHLARQHKMVDIALFYFDQGKDPKYIQYFENQMHSLNAALVAGQYEKIEDGNGVYEVFRSGYRIFNWLWIHNMFLDEAEYSDTDQLYTIATLLQHGQHLYQRNGKFRSGNHQTKGMSALATLAILLRDFEGTEAWYDLAMARLSEHLEKEINPDGFQFERSVHYHMSDINNYFYVYQLAKISGIKVDKAWEEKLRTLFTSLAKIAYPDKSAPVLQDDTEIPWAEKNDISGAMTLGYLLFEEPEFGYFASDKVADRMYWYLSNAQVDLLKNIQRKKPKYGSLTFPNTHYYVMREGWNPKDKMMIISAGLDNEKPDHQHGDMLGIQAMANGQVLLPNYQVRYSLEDFDFFKNSMVKNVALVDDELQGKQWTSNKGGSGFGKFKDLPEPSIIS
ncbi:MAG: heparinase II/III family protein [Bacteroidota bacterium]